MPLTKKIMTPVKLDYLCDVCGVGYMRPTSMTLLVNPPLYPHRCNAPKCTERNDFKVTYPHIEYE